jgi:hypothetical protein
MMNASIPDYIKISQTVTKTTKGTMSANNAAINIVFIILGIAVLTGGFDMLWNILDLF